MAAYDVVSPASLANYSAVLSHPVDGDDANLAYAYERQTRQFVYDFLAAKFDSAASDVLKAAAVVDATLVGKVKGSTANSAGSARAISLGTISTPDLRDLAITTGKLADLAVTSGKIANSAVTTDQISDAPFGVTSGKINTGAVATTNIADLAVTTAKLSSSASDDTIRAVTTDHVKNLAITAAKIAANAITGGQMATGTSGQILVADGSGVFQKVTLSGAATISNAGVLTLATTGYAKVMERATNGTAAGASLAATWNVRGVATVWVTEWETLSMITLASGGKIGLAAGTYIIEVTAPAYKSDAHICRINRYNSLDASQEIIYGTSSLALAANSEQTTTSAFVKMAFAAGDYFLLEHWTSAAEASDGLGKATSSGGTYEIYATVKIHRIA